MSPSLRSILVLCAGWAFVVAAIDRAAAARDEDLFLRSEDLRTVLFGSLDGGRSSFVSAGAKRALTGPLDRSGFVLATSSGLGVTRERLGVGSGLDGEAIRFTTESATLLGYQWSLPGLYLALLAGPETRAEQLDVTIGTRQSKPRLGARAQAELWANPTPDTLLTMTLTAGSTKGSLSGRASAGLRVAEALFVGPELSAYTNATYGEVKLGFHATGFRVGLVNARLSGGVQWQDGRREPSGYFALSTWIRL